MNGIQLGLTQKIAEAEIVINHGRVEKSRHHDVGASLLITGSKVEKVELPHVGKRGVSLEEHLSAAQELLSMAAGIVAGAIKVEHDAFRAEALGSSRPGSLLEQNRKLETLYSLEKRIRTLPIRIPDAAREDYDG